MRDYRTKKTHRGTRRNATGRLNFAAPSWGPPYSSGLPPKFPNIFGDGRPFPNTQLGKRGNAIPPNAKRQTAERHGTPRFGHTAMESAIFWRIPPKCPNIFGTGNPLPPRHPIGVGGKCETAERKKIDRGTPRQGCRIRGFLMIFQDSEDGQPGPEYHECARGVLIKCHACAHSGLRAGVLIARSLRISVTTGPCPYFALNARAFRKLTPLFCALNIRNARAPRPKSGRGSNVLNILNARAFRTPSTRPERTRSQDAQGAFRISGISRMRAHSGQNQAAASTS